MFDISEGETSIYMCVTQINLTKIQITCKLKITNRLKGSVRMLIYRVLLRKEPEGGYTVMVPFLPGCITYGETTEEVIQMAKEGYPAVFRKLRSLPEGIPTEESMLEYTIAIPVNI